MDEQGQPVRLRRATEQDRSLLFALYAADLVDAYLSLGLTLFQVHAALELQLRARDAEYARRFSGATQWIVIAGTTAVGHVLLRESSEAVRVLEFAIAAEHRRRGYGAGVIRLIQSQARACGCAVTLRVKAGSSAARLYERLGFEVEAHEGTYLQMRWPAV